MTITEYLETSERRQAEFARAVGTDRGHLNNIIAGRANASPQLVLRIEAESGGAVARHEVRPDIYPVPTEGQAA